jgi:hypothetical protein
MNTSDYDKALRDVVLIGCICHEGGEHERGQCPVCETVDTIRKNRKSAQMTSKDIKQAAKSLKSNWDDLRPNPLAAQLDDFVRESLTLDLLKTVYELSELVYHLCPDSGSMKDRIIRMRDRLYDTYGKDKLV